MSADMRSAKSRRMETLFSICLLDRMKMDRWIRFHPIPHRGEQSSDRSIPAQWAETDLSSACSAGISGAILLEAIGVRPMDPLLVNPVLKKRNLPCPQNRQTSDAPFAIGPLWPMELQSTCPKSKRMLAPGAIDTWSVYTASEPWLCYIIKQGLGLGLAYLSFNTTLFFKITIRLYNMYKRKWNLIL